jgi:hypothetical protein
LTLRIEFDSAALFEVDAADEWLEARRRGHGREFVATIGAAVDSVQFLGPLRGRDASVKMVPASEPVTPSSSWS